MSELVAKNGKRGVGSEARAAHAKVCRRVDLEKGQPAREDRFGSVRDLEVCRSVVELQYHNLVRREFEHGNERREARRGSRRRTRERDAGACWAQEATETRGECEWRRRAGAGLCEYTDARHAGLRECGRGAQRGRKMRGGRRESARQTGVRNESARVVRAELLGLVAFSVCVCVSPRRIYAGDAANGLYGPERGGLGHATRASLTSGCVRNRTQPSIQNTGLKILILYLARLVMLGCGVRLGAFRPK